MLLFVDIFWFSKREFLNDPYDLNARILEAFPEFKNIRHGIILRFAVLRKVITTHTFGLSILIPFMVGVLSLMKIIW